MLKWKQSRLKSIHRGAREHPIRGQEPSRQGWFCQGLTLAVLDSGGANSRLPPLLLNALSTLLTTSALVETVDQDPLQTRAVLKAPDVAHVQLKPGIVLGLSSPRSLVTLLYSQFT